MPLAKAVAMYGQALESFKRLKNTINCLRHTNVNFCSKGCSDVSKHRKRQCSFYITIINLLFHPRA